MKKIFFLLLFLISGNLFSQERSDSLLMLLESRTDTGRIDLLKNLCWENRYSNPRDAMKYGIEALVLSREAERYGDESEINNYLGIIQRNFGDHATALEYFFEAQSIAKEHDLGSQLGYSYNNIGEIYNLENKSGKALEYEMQALEIFESLNDSIGISYCCHQLALTCKNLSDFPRALKFDTRAMMIRDMLGNQAGVGYSLINMGEDYLMMEKYSEALENLFRSRDIFSGLDDNFGLATSLFSIGMYYKKLGELDHAIGYLTESLNLGMDTESPLTVRNAAGVLNEIYAEQERYKEAYQMHILFKESYDSLYQEENLVKITQLAMQYEFEQREIMQLAEIARQKQFRNYFIFSLGLIMILVVVVLNRYYIKRKAHLDLQNKNQEIEAQTKKLESLFVSLRIKNDELSEQNDEILTQKDHLVSLNQELEKQKFELNKALNELTQAESQLVQSEKMASLGLLTAGVAHELNNPINFISSSINPLQRNIDDLLVLLDKYDSTVQEKKLAEKFGDVDELRNDLDTAYLVNETRKLLKGISEGAFRSQQIVRDLRTFSRMEENEFTNIDIHEGIDSTLSLLGHKMEDRVKVHKDYGKIPHIECLPGKLNQVFMNILTNSILAIDGEGEIFVRSESSGNTVAISIRDTGKGMAAEVREHIFEPFFTTRPVGAGTGLGLSISYSIIEEHNGSIEVSSQPGEGTEFIITLPIRQEI
jgi:signal transduction histidine kinase